MPEWKSVARLTDVPAGGSLLVEFDGRDVAVFSDGRRLYAIDDRCPHAGASLSGGPVEDGVVTCPWHYWQFRLGDGAWVQNPRIKTRAYAVRVQDGEVQLSASPPAPQ